MRKTSFDHRKPFSPLVEYSLYKPFFYQPLSVRDIFFTQTIDGRIFYQNVEEHYLQSRDSRVVTFSFTCRFGKPAKETARKNTGASEEQNRVKAG